MFVCGVLRNKAVVNVAASMQDLIEKVCLLCCMVCKQYVYEMLPVLLLHEFSQLLVVDASAITPFSHAQVVSISTTLSALQSQV